MRCQYGPRRVHGWGIAGWVYRVGNTGPPTTLLEEPNTSEAGPVRPCRGLEWVGVGRAFRLLNPPTPLRSGARSAGSGPSLEQDPTHGRLNLRNLRNMIIYSKVSQNAEVSPKSVNKACHSPYVQNGLRNSPLGILRFPFPVAFSHKELMVLF